MPPQRPRILPHKPRQRPLRLHPIGLPLRLPFQHPHALHRLPRPRPCIERRAVRLRLRRARDLGARLGKGWDLNRDMNFNLGVVCGECTCDVMSGKTL